ncbi:P-loop containing nucleoside triphosphate hydrolase protein [Xylaria bambusicola]|uniref:P-loop containing nucleoside triphosphate hydrolase protein n=1 Tax=Xylaria bambusicola TaxID=326684 RepID=UPI002008EAEA|nr:P-loop containing nucleoside triphosphate hydrolase protein [Xylaria bambusicola]KAI0521979.1 P-loop containing nucleoside triphosphate hydrolase protein [Xylaria bambusicola]
MALHSSPGNGVLMPHIHDLGLLKDSLGRWASGQGITRLGSLAACISVAPVAWRFLKAAWTESYSWIRQFFVASVTVPGRDPLNRNVMSWVIANVVQHRGIRSFTATTRVHAGDIVDRAAFLKKKRRVVQYLPHFDTTIFWHGSCLYFVSRPLDSYRASMSDPSYDGIGGEELTIGCLGWSTEPIKKLIQTCQDYADKQAEFFVIIYARDRYGSSWQPKARKPIRQLDSVHFDDTLKATLLADIRNYLDPGTKRLYRGRNMPYRRGYLFYGPPGTGKSSLSTALAGEFGLDLYEVKIPCVASDQDLEQMFMEIPPQCIALLEDVDAIWTDRDSEKDEGQGVTRSSCTLSGLLNVLDGVGSGEGRIVIMTTNKPDRLDSALVRPGRVDLKLMLGNISRKSAEQMFVRMFAPDTASSPTPAKSTHETVGSNGEPALFDLETLHKLALEFASQIPEDTFTPSQLQGFFQLHLNSATEAVANISSWVGRELSRSPPDDDISVVSEEKTS